jgi:hypothetical protein
MRNAGCVCESFLFRKAIHGAGLGPNRKIAMAGCGWDAGLFRFLVLASGFVLLGKLGPGLRHLDQQSFVGLVRGLAGQAQAFGRAPLVVLEFGHGTLRCAATRKIAIRFLAIANVDKWALARDAIDQIRMERLSLPGGG